MEQVMEDGAMQACALKRLSYVTRKDQLLAQHETAALQAVQGAPHLAQLVHAAVYEEPVTRHISWALVMK